MPVIEKVQGIEKVGEEAGAASRRLDQMREISAGVSSCQDYKNKCTTGQC